MNLSHLYQEIKDKISNFLRCIARKFWASSVLFILACFAIFFHRDLPIFKKVFNTDGQDELIFGLSAGLIAIYIFIGTSFSLSFDKTIHGEKYLGRPIFSSSISNSKSVIFISNKLFKQLSYIVFSLPFLLPLLGEAKTILLTIWLTAFSILALLSINLSVQIITQHAIGLRNPEYSKILIGKNIWNNFIENVENILKSNKSNIRGLGPLSTETRNFIVNLKNLPQDEQPQYLNLTIFKINYYYFYNKKKYAKTFSLLLQSYHLEVLRFLAASSQSLQSDFKGILFKILDREVLLLRLDNIKDEKLNEIEDDALIRYSDPSYFRIRSTDISPEILSHIPYSLKKRYQNLFYCISLIGDSLVSNFNIFRLTPANFDEIFNTLDAIQQSALKYKLELILFKSLMIYNSQGSPDFNLRNLDRLQNSMYRGGIFTRNSNLSFEKHALEILSEDHPSQNLVFRMALPFISPENVRIKFLEILLSGGQFPNKLLNEFISYRSGKIDLPSSNKFELGEQAFNSLRNASCFIDRETVIWLFEIAGGPLTTEIIDDFYKLKEEHRLRGFRIIDLVRWIRFNLATSTNYYPIEQPYTLKITNLSWEFRYEIRNLISSFKDGNPPAGIKEGDVFVLNSFLNKLEEDSSSDEHTN